MIPAAPEEPLRRTAIIAAAIAAALALSRHRPAAGALTSEEPQRGAEPRREESLALTQDPGLAALLERVAERSLQYRKYALGFTCREIVRAGKYDVDTSGYRKNERSVFDYLFEETPQGRLRELREEVVESKDGRKRKATDFEPPLPPAYSWAFLFSPENRGRFHFSPAGQVVKAYRLLTLVDFVGISPNPGGGEIGGWSGQVALDSKTLNLWSIHAEPSGQQRRLEAAITRYQRAFAIAGVPLAERPHGWRLEVTFGLELNGLSYPTDQALSMTSLNRSGKMNLEEKTAFRYEEYRFFKVGTQEEVKETAPPGP